MSNVHAAVSEVRIRVYDDDIYVDKPIYKMNEHYYGYASCSINDVGVARIEGLTFTLTGDTLKKIFKKLKGFGVKEVTWRNKEKSISINIEDKFND